MSIKDVLENSRTSYGIACCRVNPLNIIEILLVKKRYTYAFVAFVFGHYNKKDDKRLTFLFNGMTTQEKIDILSLRFDLIWYKIWLEFPENITQPLEFDISSTEAIHNTWNALYKHKATSNFIPYSLSTSKLNFYIKKKNKFESAFMADHGYRLKNLIINTKNNELIWEVPKGRKNRYENNLDCSIREFEEETGVKPNMYDIIDNKPIIESYISDNIRYVHYYTIASTIHVFEPSVSFKHILQMSEVDSIRWASINDIKMLDSDGKLYKLVSRIFNAFKPLN
jgi:8-oxo-dGTP pyrophosphatase MutT (NUDIX family)